MRVKADRFDSFKEEMGEFMGDTEIIPVDMYGKRISRGKGEVTPQQMGEDIRDFYDLEGDAGLGEKK